MSDRHWTQDHYVTRNSTTDDPGGCRVWMTCRCGWDSGTLSDGNLPTTHQAELEHYITAALAEQGEMERQYGRRNRETGAVHWLRGHPFDDWWDENQDQYEHVMRFVTPPLPVPDTGAES